MMSGKPWYSDFSAREERGVYKRTGEGYRGGSGEGRGVGWENQHFMEPSLVELLYVRHCNVNRRYCVTGTVPV